VGVTKKDRKTSRPLSLPTGAAAGPEPSLPAEIWDWQIFFVLNEQLVASYLLVRAMLAGARLVIANPKSLL